MISLADVSYAYPDTDTWILSHLDLEVEAGSITGIVGASGAGKTTLAKIISGFIPHVDGGTLNGTVTVDGVALASATLADAVSHVGLVIQSPFNQISGAKFTVREELAFGLENLGTPRPEMETRVAEAATLLGISELLDRSPYALSGGQQQLVAIASMIIMKTPVLVMDEPTSQLDPGGTRMVFDVMARLRDSGVTIVIFEHKLELLREHCDVVHALALKRLSLSGDPRTALADPRLDAWGIGATRFTDAAVAAQQAGLIPADAVLPVSIDDAAETFGDYSTTRSS